MENRLLESKSGSRARISLGSPRQEMIEQKTNGEESLRLGHILKVKQREFVGCIGQDLVFYGNAFRSFSRENLIQGITSSNSGTAKTLNWTVLVQRLIEAGSYNHP